MGDVLRAAARGDSGRARNIAQLIDTGRGIPPDVSSGSWRPLWLLAPPSGRSSWTACLVWPIRSAGCAHCSGASPLP
jgi:hypothetical protein